VRSLLPFPQFTQGAIALQEDGSTIAFPSATFIQIHVRLLLPIQYSRLCLCAITYHSNNKSAVKPASIVYVDSVLLSDRTNICTIDSKSSGDRQVLPPEQSILIDDRAAQIAKLPLLSQFQSQSAVVKIVGDRPNSSCTSTLPKPVRSTYRSLMPSDRRSNSASFPCTIKDCNK
jgi:hypothetical protein